MRIAKIIGKNFRRGNFNHELAPVTILVGKNFTGKTSVVKAGVFALCGKLPGLAETAAAVYERCACGSVMSALVVADNGHSICRTVSPKRKGDGVETDVEVVGFDKDYKADPVLFNAKGEFLQLSDKERGKYLFRILPPPPVSEVGPESIIAGLKNIKLDPHTQHAEKCINDLCAITEKSYHTGKAAQVAIQEWLTQFVEEIRVRATTANATAKRMKTTILGVAQLKNPDAASLSAAEGKMQRATATLETATGILTTARANAATKVAQLKEARRVAASYVEPEAGALTKAEAEVEKLIKQGRLTQYDSVRLARLILEAETDLEKTPIADQAAMKLAVENQTKAAHAANKVGSDLLGSRENIKGIKEEIEAAEHAKACPTCGKNLDKAKQKKLIGEIHARLEQAERELVAFEAALAFAREVELSAVAANSKLQDVWNTRNDKKTKLSELRTQHTAALTIEKTCKEEWQTSFDAAKAAVQTIKDTAALAAPAKAAAELIPALEKELETMKAEGAVLVTKEQETRAASESASAAHRQALADAASAQQAALAATKADEAEIEAQVTKQLSEQLAVLLQKCITLSVNPFLATVNLLCAPLLPAPLNYKDGAIGLDRETGTTWHSLSGAEEKIVLCALGIALATTADFKLAILDEMGVLDPQRRIKAFHLVRTLVAGGALDQAILIDSSPDNWDEIDNNEEVKVIRF